MIIAMASDDGLVSNHFGHCKEFIFYQITNDSKVEDKKCIKNPEHRPGYLPLFIKKLFADVIIAGGMGATAQGLFVENDIEVVVGVQGRCDEVLKAYLSNTLVTTLIDMKQNTHKCFSKSK